MREFLKFLAVVWSAFAGFISFWMLLASPMLLMGFDSPHAADSITVFMIIGIYFVVLLAFIASIPLSLYFTFRKK